MDILVVFPKAECYVGKSLDTQRIYRATVKKYVSILDEANCNVECLLEDELGRLLLPEMYHIARLNFNKTCISENDITFFASMQDYLDLPAEIYQEWHGAECYAYDSAKRYTVPIELIREDRNKFMDKKVDVYRKRLRYATDKFIAAHKNVLMFRMDNGTDRATALRETIVEGDGRLLIEVNLNSNMAVTYYGGVFLPETNIKTIISL